MEELSASKKYSIMGYSYASFYVLWNILVVASVWIYADFIYKKGQDSDTVRILISLVTELIACAVFFYMVKKAPKEKITGRKLRLGELLTLLCISYTLSIAGSLIGTIVNGFLAKVIGSTSVSHIAVFVDANWPLMAVYAVLLAPIVEELLFRKLLIDRIVAHGELIAVMTSGILFGLIHGNIEQFFYTFFLGCIFGYIYVRTGNIKYTIGLHMFINGVSIMLQYFLIKLDILSLLQNNDDIKVLVDSLTSDNHKFMMFSLMAIIALAEYAMAFIGLILLCLNFKKAHFNKDGRKEASFKETIFSKGMIVFFVAFIIIQILNAYNWFR